MHLFRYFIFALLASIQLSVLAMDQALSASLPDEVWKQILEWVNYREDAIRSEHARTDEKLMSVVRSINNLVRHSRLCKATYRTSASLIASYLQWSADHLKLENMHSLLHSAVTKWDYIQKKLVPLYRKLGADINHIHQDGDTLVTYAIKHQRTDLFETLLKMGADLMQPNRRGQVPIDLAYDIYPKMAVFFKDNGGDPEDTYKYWKADNIIRGAGGYHNYRPKKKPIADVSLNSILQQQPVPASTQIKAPVVVHSTNTDSCVSAPIQPRCAMEWAEPLLAQPPIPVVDKAQKKKKIVDVSSNNIAQQQFARVVQQNQAASAIQTTDDYIPVPPIQPRRAMKQPTARLTQPPILVVDRAQNLTAATQKAWSAGFTRGCITGIAACCIGYWIYNLCYGTDDEQAEDEQGNENKSAYR